MTVSVTLSNSRLLVTRDGVTRLDTDQPMLHSVFLTGTVSLPQRQAWRYFSNELVIDQTDSYAVGSIPSGADTVFGMLRWQVPGNAERLVNDGDKWQSYSGELLQMTWASTNGPNPQFYVATDYSDLTSFATFWFEPVGTTLYLRDKMFIRAPYTVSTTTPITRTRPASTLEYRLYAGAFS